VADTDATVALVAEAFSDSGKVDRLDGLSVSGPTEGDGMWWFNVRASNTEPLLRLNVEAANEELLHSITDEVLAVITSN